MYATGRLELTRGGWVGGWVLLLHWLACADRAVVAPNQVVHVHDWMEVELQTAQAQHADQPDVDAVGVLVKPYSTTPATMSWTVKWPSGVTGVYSVWPRTELQVGAGDTCQAAPHAVMLDGWYPAAAPALRSLL